MRLHEVCIPYLERMAMYSSSLLIFGGLHTIAAADGIPETSARFVVPLAEVGM